MLAVAERLDVPLRERNTLLLTAGYAPPYSHRSMDDPAMRNVRSSLQRMLDSHDPYPGVAIDRHWNVVLANEAAGGVDRRGPGGVAESGLNVFRVSLHPDGLAARTVNFTEWAAYLLRQLRRSIQADRRPGPGSHRARKVAYPNSRILLPPPATVLATIRHVGAVHPVVGEAVCWLTADPSDGRGAARGQRSSRRP